MTGLLPAHSALGSSRGLRERLLDRPYRGFPGVLIEYVQLGGLCSPAEEGGVLGVLIDAVEYLGLARRKRIIPLKSSELLNSMQLPCHHSQ